MLNEHGFCPGMLQNYLYNSDSSPYQNVSKAVMFVLHHRLGSRSIRHYLMRYLRRTNDTANINEIYQKAISVYNSLLMINKRYPILGTNIELPSNDPRKLNVLPYVIHIDYTYTRKNGDVYGVVLYDMPKVENTRQILQHIIVHGAIVAEVSKRHKKLKYVEVLIPTMDTYADRYLLKLDPKMRKMSAIVDFCENSLYNAARRYYVTEEHLTNSSYKCIRCPQKSGCIVLNRDRADCRGDIRELRIRDN